MKARTGPGRVGSLVIELAARTAKIDGIRVELPPTEFALLAVLAARPGEVVSHKILAAEAFGEGVPWAPHDLHWRIWRLRDLIGDHGEREHELVENRRGQGYVLDLPPNAVEVVEGVAPEPAPVSDVIHLDDQPVPAITRPAARVGEPAADLPASLPAIDADDTATAGSPRRRPRPVAVLVGVAVTLVALAGSWSAGYLISSTRSRSSTPAAPAAGSESSEEEPEAARKPRRAGKGRGRREPRANKRQRSGKDANSEVAVPSLAGPPPPAQSVQTQEASEQTSPQSKPDPPRAKPRPAPLPPAPTRYLYHLVHPETGDHFVTTDGNIASQQEARGYEGGAIARVYTSAVEGTRAISTNQGTAYIFVASSPKTEPETRAVPLWYSTNNQGDFFYTTNENEARQAGWSASRIGYVGSL